MRETLRVVVLGTGRMGAGIVALLLEKPGLELAGVFARRRERGGMDVGEAVGLGRRLSMAVTNDLPRLCRETRPHVGIQATCSRLVDAADEIRTLVDHGADVVSIAEEMAFPRHRSPDIAAELDARALARGVSVLGTGINPGFVLDTLVVALSGVCQRVDAVLARRVNDLSPYGPTVLASQGVGLSAQEFRRAVADGVVTGHHGFPESMQLIAHALGWRLDRIEQRREPILSSVERELEGVRVAPGFAAGCAHTAVAYVGERAVIELVHPQQVLPQLEGVKTGDFIEISGRPPLRMSIRPEIPGGVATAALAVNVLPEVVNAAPGLRVMTELPAAAALMGDVREHLGRVRGGQAGG